jgi:hypothetical protein
MLIRLFNKMFEPKTRINLTDLTLFQKWIWLDIDWEDHKLLTNWDIIDNLQTSIKKQQINQSL